MLFGFVLPAAGSELPDPLAVVHLIDRYGEQRRCESGQDGAYSFSDIPSGRYWIVAGAQRGGQMRLVIDLDAAVGDRRLDLQLEREHEVQVEVVDGAGEPIRDVFLTAVATREAPGDWCEVYGSANNPFGVGAWAHNGFAGRSFPRTVLGCVRLQLPPPLFVSVLHNQRVVATQRVELGQEIVRFVLDRGSPLLQKGRLKLRLIDAQTRQPLPGVNLQLVEGTMMQSGRTELDGTFSGAAMPGWLSLETMGGALENPELRVRIEAGVETDLGDIALEAAVSISGSVVDEHGKGMAVRIDHVVLDPTSNRPIRSGVNFAARSSADGTFRISGLGRRLYRLNVDVKDGEYARASVLVDARAGSVEGVRMELRVGTPLFLSSSDQRWSEITFDIIDAHGTLVLSSSSWGPEPRKILLAPGQYAIDVRVGERGEPVRREFTIDAQPVELSLP